MRRLITCSMIAGTVALLAGCETLSLTALGIGGSAMVQHRVSGTPARTFTAPIGKVRRASMTALKRMGIVPGGLKKIEKGELIVAEAGGREIEVELEAITPNTTRMQVTARRTGFFQYDAPTASEIIEQTEKGLGI